MSVNIERVALQTAVDNLATSRMIMRRHRSCGLLLWFCWLRSRLGGTRLRCRAGSEPVCVVVRYDLQRAVQPSQDCHSGARAKRRHCGYR